MAYEPNYFASRVRVFLAGLAVVGHYLAGTALSVFDVLFLEPLRWLFHPDHSIELELRRLDRITPESLHLERDKPRRAFMERLRARKIESDWLMPDAAFGI